MVGHCARVGGRRFDGIEPGHFRLVVFHAALARKFTRVPDTSRSAREQFRIERKDYVRAFHAVHRIKDFSKRDFGSLAHIVTSYRLILMPLGGGICFQKCADLRAKRRRSNGLSQNPDSRSARFHFSCKRRR